MTHSLPKARVLFIPYEKPPSRETASRRALRQLEHAGLIDALDIYSIQDKINELGTSDAIHGLRDVVATFKPNLVLLYHPIGTGLDYKEYRILRSLADFQLVYHEIDVYHWLRNPFPKEVRAAARASDVTYTSGAGTMASSFRRFGAPEVQWMAQAFDPHAIKVDRVRRPSPADIVMIANNGVLRNPLGSHPGARSRRKLVNILTQRFGDRFRVYGRGWTGPSAGGPLPFSEVDEVLAGAVLSVNWDHYPTEPKYFSNRLPMSLASGSVHFTTWHPGYDEIFPSGLDFLHFGHSPENLADKVESFISQQSNTNNDFLSKQATSFAHERFRRDDAVAGVIRNAGFELDLYEREKTWSISVDPFPDLDTLNPHDPS